MFEVTIRTDDQAALQKLMEFLASLDLQLFKEPIANGEKSNPEFIVEQPKGQQTHEAFLLQKRPFFSKRWSKGPIPFPPDFDESLEKFKPGFGGAKGMIELSPDWDEPLEDFKEYM